VRAVEPLDVLTVDRNGESLDGLRLASMRGHQFDSSQYTLRIVGEPESVAVNFAFCAVNAHVSGDIACGEASIDRPDHVLCSCRSFFGIVRAQDSAVRRNQQDNGFAALGFAAQEFEHGKWLPFQSFHIGVVERKVGKIS
jgi:hypothetical protein